MDGCVVGGVGGGSVVTELEAVSWRENISTEAPQTGQTWKRVRGSERWSVSGSQRCPWEHTCICRMMDPWGDVFDYKPSQKSERCEEPIPGTLRCDSRAIRGSRLAKPGEDLQVVPRPKGGGGWPAGVSLREALAGVPDPQGQPRTPART